MLTASKKPMFLFDEDFIGVKVRGDLGFQSAISYDYLLNITDKAKWERAKNIIATYRQRPEDGYTVWHIQEAEDAELLLENLWEVTVPIGFDFETIGWSPTVKLPDMNGKLAVMDVSPSADLFQPIPVCFQISWGHVGYLVDAQHLPLFEKYLAERADLDIANVNFEMTVFRRLGMSVRRFWRDVIHMDWLHEESPYRELNRPAFGSRGLKPGLAPYYLGLSPKDFDTTFGHKPFNEALAQDPVTACGYAGFDPIVTSWVADVLQRILEQRETTRPGYANTFEVYKHVERPAQMSVIHMENTGVPISKNAALKHHAGIKAELERLEGAALKAVGRPVQLTSPTQLRKLLYQERGLPVHSTTKGFYCLICGKQVSKTTLNCCSVHGAGAIINKESTDDKVLEALAQLNDPVAKFVQEHRTLNKELGTWVKGLYRLSQGSGKYHPSYNMTGTVSGRLAAGISLTTPKHLKDLYGFGDLWSADYDPKKGTGTCLIDEEEALVMVGGDYSQVEPRVMAHLCNDPTMIGNFKAGRDSHSTVAALILAYEEAGAASFGNDALVDKWYNRLGEARKKDKKKLPLDAVDLRCLLTRDRAKTVNLGLMYGMATTTLAQRMGCTVAEAETIVGIIFGNFKRMKPHLDESLEKAKKQGFVNTLGGRRKMLLELASQDAAIRAEGERLTRNVPCQGGARDIVMLSHISIDLDLEAGGAYGTTGRGSYGNWVDGVWQADWSTLPKGWEVSPPLPLFGPDLGFLGFNEFKLWMECHDEFQGYCKKKVAQACGNRLNDLMVSPFGGDIQFNVPLVVEWKIGTSWAETK